MWTRELTQTDVCRVAGSVLYERIVPLALRGAF